MSGIKSGHGCLRNLSSRHLQMSLLTVFDFEINGYLQSGLLPEVVAYKKWLLQET